MDISDYILAHWRTITKGASSLPIISPVSDVPTVIIEGNSLTFVYVSSEQTSRQKKQGLPTAQQKLTEKYLHSAIDWKKVYSLSFCSGPYIAGWQWGQLPPPGKLIGVKTKRLTRNPVCIREIPVKVCGVCPRRQKILGTTLKTETELEKTQKPGNCTKTEKPRCLSAKTEKSNQKLARSAKPKIPTPPSLMVAFRRDDNLRTSLVHTACRKANGGTEN